MGYNLPLHFPLVMEAFVSLVLWNSENGDFSFKVSHFGNLSCDIY